MPNTTIIIIRHAEKLEWVQGMMPNAQASYIDNHLLSGKGMERAHALSGYFMNRREILDLYEINPLTTIIAQDDDPLGKGKSLRPRETIWPLLHQDPNLYCHDQASILKLQKLVQTPFQLFLYTKQKYKTMLESLKRDFDNQTVIVSWNHKEILKILADLGVPFDQLFRKWHKDRYDITIVVKLTENGATMQQLPQRLMFGDLNTILT